MPFQLLNYIAKCNPPNVFTSNTLNGQFSGLKLLILAENSSTLMIFLISNGTMLDTSCKVFPRL